MDLLFIKIAGDMGESFPVSPAIFIYREVSTKNSNIKCEYAIISIMIHLYRGRIKHKKLLSKKRGGNPLHQNKKKLPIGIDNFEKLRLNDFYYVDKTGLIKELLKNWGEVNLFTRPRRFGKSLNMSMLENVFSIEKNQEIFRGLEIVNETALCEEYMGKYPVISISLKSVNAASFESAFQLTAQ